MDTLIKPAGCLKAALVPFLYLYVEVVILFVSVCVF